MTLKMTERECVCVCVSGRRAWGGRGRERGMLALSQAHTHRLTLPPYTSSNLAEERTWGRGLSADRRQAGRQMDRQIVRRGRTDWAKEGEERQQGDPRDNRDQGLLGRDKQCLAVVSACPCRGPHFRSSYLGAGVSPWHMAAKSLGPELELEVIWG